MCDCSVGLHSFLEALLHIANSSSNYTQTLSNMPLKLVRMKSAYLTLFKKAIRHDCYDSVVGDGTLPKWMFLPVDSVVGKTIK